MHKRHINEFRHTSLANSGRAAGIGMLYDRYDEESGLPQIRHNVDVVFPSRTEEEKAALNGPVVVRKLT